MSKRKGSTLNRQSKRHKSNHYNDGKTDLERELEIYDQTTIQQEQDEFYRAQQELQRQQHANTNTTANINQTSYTSSGIALGTPLSDDDDEDDDIEDGDYHQNNNIHESDSDYADHHVAQDYKHQTGYIHPERSAQMDHHSTDYSQSKTNNTASHQAIATPETETLTFRDLRAHQMTRNSLERICCEPYFSDFIGRSRVQLDEHYDRELPGLFCRIYIGDRQTSSGSTEPIYRVCEMMGTEDWKRPYPLTDKKRTVSVGLLIAHGRNTRVFKIIQTSNSPFTEKEFNQWKQTMHEDGLSLPTKDELSEAYLNAVKRHKNFKYDTQQIAIMREKKNKNFNASALANPHKEKLRIGTQIASLNEEDPERPRLERYLVEINLEIERRNSQQSQSIKVSIASINEKNKIKNKKLMLKAREKERKRQLRMKGKRHTKDPFTRAITAPKIESFNSNLVDDELEETKRRKMEEERLKKEEEEKRMKRKKSMLLRENRNDHCQTEEIRNLSILKHQIQKKHQTKEIRNKSMLLSDNGLWMATVHSVAKHFVSKCKNIDLNTCNGMMVEQPQFGRNTNQSKYGCKFSKVARDLQIISIEEYLRTKKYSAM
eukprot:102962_1